MHGASQAHFTVRYVLVHNVVVCKALFCSHPYIYLHLHTWSFKFEFFFNKGLVFTYAIFSMRMYRLKVSKFQKQIFLFSFEPKNGRNYFLNSALASKMSQIKKMQVLYYINYGVFNTIEALFFLFDPF